MKRDFHKTPAQANPHALYEARKREWVSKNPDATPAEYEAALRRIAHELRV